jgi:hypothetical protein
MINDDGEFDSLEEALDHYRANRPPPDVVPRKGCDRDLILALNDAAGESLDYHDPGTVFTGPDGTPIGVTPDRTGNATLGRPIIGRAVLEAAGLTEEDVPNVRIV